MKVKRLVSGLFFSLFLAGRALAEPPPLCVTPGTLCIPYGTININYTTSGSGSCTWNAEAIWGDGNHNFYIWFTNNFTMSHQYVTDKTANKVYTLSVTGSGKSSDPNNTCTFNPYTAQVEVPSFTRLFWATVDRKQMRDLALRYSAKASALNLAMLYVEKKISKDLPPLVLLAIEHSIFMIRATAAAETAAANWLNLMANDPPDPNFTELAQLSVPQLPPLGTVQDVPASLLDAFNALISSDELVIGLERALLTSMERAQGALQADNQEWFNRQMGAVTDFSTQLALLLAAQPDLLSNLKMALAEANVTFQITGDDVQNFKQDLTQNGLLPELIDTLEALGENFDSIERARSELIGLDANAIVGGFPDALTRAELIDALQNLSGSFAKAAQFALVKVDVKPDDSVNTINPLSRGVIPVAILTTSTFDASTVDALSVRFGPSGAASEGRTEDVNNDGKKDLIFQFPTPITGIGCGDTSATLVGKTKNGADIKGLSYIRTVGC